MPMGVCRHCGLREDILPFKQLFTEWKSDHFQLRYSKKREKTPQHGVWGVGRGVGIVKKRVISKNSEIIWIIIPIGMNRKSAKN